MKKLLLALAAIVAITFGAHAYFAYLKYNVILITVDTFRRDYSSCYNSNAPETPNIDRLAHDGVLFKNAFTLIPLTLPAHTSIMTSHPPHELNVFNNGDIYDHKKLLLPEILSKNGYQTAAFVSMGVLKAVFGLHPGFQTYRDDFTRSGRWYIVASEVNSEVLPWIQQHKNHPFFTWIHYSDPHEPYITVDAPPDTELWINDKLQTKLCMAKKEKNFVPFNARPGENKIELRLLEGYGVNGRLNEYVGMRLGKPNQQLELTYGDGWKTHKRRKDAMYYEGHGVATFVNPTEEEMKAELILDGRGKNFQPLETVKKNYAAEVNYLDRYIGELLNHLEKLGIKEKTILILTADHGEGLAEHGRVGHGFPLYKEVVEVPLIIDYPKVGRKGAKVNQVVNHLDIMPTILDLLHIENKAAMSGQSLKRFLSRSPVDFLFAHRMDRSRTFFYTYAPQGKSDSFSVLENNIKLIQTRAEVSWKWEAYDLKRDPVERDNFADDPNRSGSATNLRKILEDESRDAEELHGKHRKPVLDEEQRRMLRDLGYIAP